MSNTTRLPWRTTLLWPVRYLINRFLFGNSRKIRGKGNSIHIGNSLLTETSILIEGDGNVLHIGDGLRLFHVRIVVKGRGCRIVFEGPGYFTGKLICGDSGSRIKIGSGGTTEGALLVAHEGTSIQIGNDCALGSGVTIQSSDTHAIYDTLSGKRLNPAQDIEIQRHVWIAQGATILKGSVIGEGAVIGARALVTRANPIPPSAIAVGIPAQTVSRNIHWTRERTGGKYENRLSL